MHSCIANSPSLLPWYLRKMDGQHLTQSIAGAHRGTRAQEARARLGLTLDEARTAPDPTVPRDRLAPAARRNRFPDRHSLESRSGMIP